MSLITTARSLHQHTPPSKSCQRFHRLFLETRLVIEGDGSIHDSRIDDGLSLIT